MKILLISPRIDSYHQTAKGMLMPQLALHLLAGLTPPRHEVKIVEEEIEPISLSEDCDLVGLSCMTSNAPRAYGLARDFRKRGKTVVLGGVHPTILPDEALQFADAVVIGEAEGVWSRLLDDYEDGRLQKTYHDPFPPLERYIPVRYRKGLSKGIFRIIPVMTTRGCPYDCDFCCVHDIYGSKIRHVPVENVVRYIIDTGGKKFMFLDDNIVGDPGYAKDLFGAIKRLKIQWVGQASLSLVRDAELWKMAADSGCGGLFFGLESVSEGRLGKMRKSLKKIADIEAAIKKIRNLGIHLMASVVFGFDEDTPRTFVDTLEFLNRNKVGSATFNVLTPYPGTAIYRQLKKDNRLLTDDWKYFNHNTVVYVPAGMTPGELASGRLWARKQFTKISSILRRFPYHLAHPLFYLALNINSHRSCKKQLKDLPRLSAELSRLEGRKLGRPAQGDSSSPNAWPS